MKKALLTNAGPRRDTLFSIALWTALFFALLPHRAHAQTYRWTNFVGLPGTSGSADGSGSAARFYRNAGVCTDAAGNIYVADRFNYTIRAASPTGVVTTLAGLASVSGSTNGASTAARFNEPFGVVVDSHGNLFVADRYNHCIRKISAGVVSTLAGLEGTSGSANGTGSSARFNQPVAVAIDDADTLYVADYGNLTIRAVTSAGVVTTLAGSAGSSGSTDATGSSARFAGPVDVAWQRSSNTLFVADESNYTIRRITSAGTVSTFAGSAGLSGSADGTGTAARFLRPGGVAVDGSGNIFVTDTGNNTIRRITSARVVTTIGGIAGIAGSADGLGTGALFNQPYRLAVRPNGNLVVSDGFNQRLSCGVTGPEVVVEQPVGTPLANGSSTPVNFGTVGLGGSASLLFTIRDLGSTGLAGLALTKDGLGANDFTIAGPSATSVASGGSTTFTVTFAPVAGGTRPATLHLASNDPNGNPFNISLLGTSVLSVTASAGAHGTVAPGGVQTVSYGGSLVFNATAEPGYTVSQWLVGGSVAQNAGTSFALSNITANQSVQVTFVATVMATAGQNGTVTPGTIVNVSPGSDATFTATPSEGYEVDQWLVDGSVAQQGGKVFALHVATGREAVSVTFKHTTDLVYGVFPETERQPLFTDFYASDGSYGGVIYFRRNAHKRIIGIDRFILSNTAGGGGMQVNFDIHGRPARLETTDGLSISFYQRANGKVLLVGHDASGMRVRANVAGFESSLPTAAAELMALIPELRETDFTGPAAAVASARSLAPHAFTVSGWGAVASSRLFFSVIKVGGLGVDVLGTAAASLTGAGAVLGGAKITLDTIDLYNFVNQQTPVTTGMKPLERTIEGTGLAVEAAEKRAEIVSKWYNRSIRHPGTRVKALERAGLFELIGGVATAIGDVVAEHFEIFPVRPSAGPHGTVSPFVLQGVAFGDSVTFAATPEANYKVDQWLVNGSPEQEGGIAFTLPNVQEAATVQVTFTLKFVNVTLTSGPHGTINPTGLRTIEGGSDLTVTATPNAGYVVDQWVVDGQSASTGGNSFTVPHITKDLPVSVTFKPSGSYIYTGTIPSVATTVISADTDASVAAAVEGTMSVAYDASTDTYKISASWSLSSPSISGTADNSGSVSGSGSPPATIALSLPGSGSTSGADLNLTRNATGYTGSVTCHTSWVTRRNSTVRHSGVADTTHSPVNLR